MCLLRDISQIKVKPKFSRVIFFKNSINVFIINLIRNNAFLSGGLSKHLNHIFRRLLPLKSLPIFTTHTHAHTNMSDITTIVSKLTAVVLMVCMHIVCTLQTFARIIFTYTNVHIHIALRDRCAITCTDV
jgi:hypothetical protein